MEDDMRVGKIHGDRVTPMRLGSRSFGSSQGVAFNWCQTVISRCEAKKGSVGSRSNISL